MSKPTPDDVRRSVAQALEWLRGAHADARALLADAEAEGRPRRGLERAVERIGHVVPQVEQCLGPLVQDE